MTIDAGLAQLFRRHLPDGDWTRVENMIASGLPDLNFCLAGSEGWIELKRVRGWRVGFQVGQVPWIERRLQAGGRVLVAGRKLASGGRGTFWLWAGRDARSLLGRDVREVPALVCSSGLPGTWDWAAVRACLSA